jgi:transposase
MSKGKKRRRSAGEKLRIVMKGMECGVEVWTVCRQEGISPTQYYARKKQLMASAEAVFSPDKAEGRSSGREAELEAELARMKGVVAEITAENLELKKTL